jgi:BolA protein
MTRAEEIVARLKSDLAAEHVEIEDESHRHAGHQGAAGGGGHFNVTVVSARFEGLDRLARHRAIHAALDDLMGGAIHALSARALTPDEWRRR